MPPDAANTADVAGINYRPLQGMRHFFGAAFRASLKDHIGQAALAGLLIVLPAVGIFTANLFPVVFGVALYFAFLAARASNYENRLWVTFAAANGWTLDMTTPLLEMVPPSMQFGHDQKFSPIIQAQLGGLNCDLFSYDTTVGEGRYQQVFAYTAARVPLPVSLPHMLLLSKKAGAELQRDIVDKEDIQLEGDFDDYFKLQIEQGQQIDVLTVITPDVMQTLVQYNQAGDIEILGIDLYFIMGMDNRGPERVQHLVGSVVALSRRIIENVSQEQV